MLLALVIFSAFIAYRLRTTELPDRDIVSDGDRDYKHLWRAIPKAPPVEPPVAEKDSKPFFTERDEAVLTGIRRAKPLTPEILRFWEDNPPPPASNVPNYTFTYDLIIKNQFPSSCEGKKFLMYSIGQSGIGSDMHIISWGLAVAMDSNRIFVYEPHQSWRWADSDFCQYSKTPDCYFLPVTNCSIPEGVSSGSAMGTKVPDDPVVVTISQDHSNYHMWHLPPVLEKMSFIMPWEPERISNWRAVSTSFLWRPNARFSEFLHKAFVRIFGGDGTPPGRAFAIHVRHGDKGREMKLHPLSEYLDEAEKLKQNYTYLQKSDVVLLSTEDDQVVREAEAWNEAHPTTTQWQFIYLNDPKQNNHYSAPMARWHFVNAYLLAAAEAFVMTTGSNWCRIINEMRKTEGKYDYAFKDLDVGEW